MTDVAIGEKITPQQVFSGSNTESKAVFAEIITNSNNPLLNVIHTTFYDEYGIREVAEESRKARIQPAETRQLLRRYSDNGYYTIEDDFVLQTDLSKVSTAASGFLLEAGVRGSIPIMPIIGYTSLNQSTIDIQGTILAATYQEVGDEHVLGPLHERICEETGIATPYSTFVGIARKLEKTGAITLGHSRYLGFNKDRDNSITVTAGDYSTLNGKRIHNFIQTYLKLRLAVEDNPASIVEEGTERLTSTVEKLHRDGKVPVVVRRSLEAAGRFGK
jgi:hypothetical protein